MRFQNHLLVVAAMFSALGCSSGTTSSTDAVSAGATPASTTTTSSSLSLSPAASTVAYGGTLFFTASGGVPPYTYSDPSGQGSIDSATGSFVAPAISESVEIVVNDSLGAAAYATVTVNSTGGSNSSGLHAAYLPNPAYSGETITLYPSGGVAPYTYTKISGAGTLNGNLYLTASTAEVAEIEVTDSSNQATTVSITVTLSTLQISPQVANLGTGSALTFSASGGSGSYVYTVVSGGGTFTGAVFTAPSTAGTTVVQVEDTVSQQVSQATITVALQVPLSSTVQYSVDDSIYVTFDMPYDTTTYVPSFVSGGAGPKGDFGRNVNEPNGSDYTSLAPVSGTQPGSGSIALTNYNASSNYPYTGMLEFMGRSGTDLFGFCIEAGSRTALLVRQSGSQSLVPDLNLVSFASFAANATAGYSVQGLWIKAIDGQSGAGPAGMAVVGGQHSTTMTNCSSYSTGTSLSSYSNN